MSLEEIPNPVVEGPRIMIATVLIGIGTGFIFLVRTSSCKLLLHSFVRYIGFEHSS